MLLSKSCLVATQVSDLQHEKLVCEPALTLDCGWSAHAEPQPVPGSEQLTAHINLHCSLLEASNSSVWVSHCKLLFLPYTSEVTKLSCLLHLFCSQYLGEVKGLRVCLKRQEELRDDIKLLWHRLTSASGPNRAVLESPASEVHNCCTHFQLKDKVALRIHVEDSRKALRAGRALSQH